MSHEAVESQAADPAAAPAALDLLIELAPAWARAMYSDLVTKLGALMGKVQVEESDLANIQTTLSGIADDLENELGQLNVPAGDLSGVQAVVNRLRTDVAVPTPAPAPTPPTPDPAPAPEPAPTPAPVDPAPAPPPAPPQPA